MSETTSAKTIRSETRDGVRWLTIDNEPRLNALTAAMWQGMTDAVRAAERAYRAHECAETAIYAAAPGPLLLTEIDLLFEPTLHLDVLALLRQASRTTSLVVTWPGSYANGILAYAVPQHGHYCTWHKPEVSIVALG